MLDFDKPPIEKSAEERTFDELNVEYRKKFGVTYVFNVGFPMTWDEVFTDIRRRIAENDPQPVPDYKPGELY